MVAINMEKPTDCKKCPLMGTDGTPKDLLNAMMCVAIWATTHEIKYCISGKIRDDCPLVEIGTCKDCRHCRKDFSFTDKPKCLINALITVNDDFYCRDFKKRGTEDGI